MKSIILGSEQITKDSILEQFKLPDLSNLWCNAIKI